MMLTCCFHLKVSDEPPDTNGSTAASLTISCLPSPTPEMTVPNTMTTDSAYSSPLNGVTISTAACSSVGIDDTDFSATPTRSAEEVAASTAPSSSTTVYRHSPGDEDDGCILSSDATSTALAVMEGDSVHSLGRPAATVTVVNREVCNTAAAKASEESAGTYSSKGVNRFSHVISGRGKSQKRIVAYSTAMESIQASSEPVELEIEEQEQIP
ncbi:unnamed protein product [Protopolystoma xenopodis]|uniref:Uncharacterized protein n=1 Tax=Protopolystoma xenopodis TaxID=117903 RepID=A0A448X8F0_9PLAT|nr:unnamed protein product [Protopolystoma xenopodis]